MMGFMMVHDVGACDVLWSMKCLDLFPLAQGPGDVKHEPLADRGDDPLAEQIIGDGSL